MPKRHLRTIALLVSCFLISGAAVAEAASFNTDRVLEDEHLEDYTTMNESAIQAFLAHRGALGSYVARDIDGASRTASAIVARVAQTYRLNPQFLLTLLQREQGLVEADNPTETQLAWATGFSICDRCDMDHPDLQEYRGFANQLEESSKRIREKFLVEIDTVGSTFTGWGPGIPKYADGIVVTPENRVTAALYTYTPHIAGNRLLWSIWQSWFSLRYPDGTLLQTETDPQTVWLIQSGLKRPIASLATLVSRFDPGRIITVSREELARYEMGRPILFPDFSLVRSPRGTVYLLRGENRHGFPSREVFASLGFHDDEVTDVTWEDLALHEEGAPLSLAEAYPLGTLLQNRETGGVYSVISGTKYPIWSREIMRRRFPARSITTVDPEVLETYTTGDPVKFTDGELVGLLGQPDVFVISHGKRRPIPAAEVFEIMGWRWENVIWTNEKALLLHPLDAPIVPETQPDTSIALGN